MLKTLQKGTITVLLSIQSIYSNSAIFILKSILIDISKLTLDIILI